MNAESFIHYKLNIKEIDDQHWELITLMNYIIDQPIDAIHPIYNINTDRVIVIRDKMIDHFKYEEMCMEKDNYPYREYHTNVHHTITSQLNDIIKKRADTYLTYTHVVRDLRQAVVDHIDRFDMQYGDWLKKQPK
jgi:hemerythrin-like metal-binding protein